MSEKAVICLVQRYFPNKPPLFCISGKLVSYDEAVAWAAKQGAVSAEATNVTSINDEQDVFVIVGLRGIGEVAT